NILAISPTDVRYVALFASAALLTVGVIFRPLLFSSVDAEIAEARGVPVRGLAVLFAVLLGFAVATSVQVVGVLLIFALLILPAATAQHLTARPDRAIGVSVLIAVWCVWLGLLVGFYLPYPPSFFITTFAFLTFIVLRTVLPGVAGRGLHHPGWTLSSRHGPPPSSSVGQL
ncbi:MAG: metal ABC transporter permease, partial [Chloroflexi bacterium]|nr:metal ABC transporter permease [Chloroflexota bacterium]